VTVAFDPYTCLVGPNGAGKSTVLAALNVLFRNSSGSSLEVSVLSREDFCDRDVSSPVEIIATFVDLSAGAQADLAEYVRHGELVVSARAVWDEGRQSAPVKQYGKRLVMKEFAKYFEADKRGVKVGELKAIFAELRSRFADLSSAATKGDMEGALRQFEESHRELCELTDSEDQFYGVSRGANRLARYIQWVYVPAVKDAADEQVEGRDTALGQLLQRTIRSELNFDTELSSLRAEAVSKYQGLLKSKDESLAGVEKRLEQRLQRWAHPGARVQLRWDAEAENGVSVNAPFARVKVGEGDFVGEVPRLGHGMQRAFIVAMLQELASSDEGEAPTLLLGFEEPELYQHPPQARHLAAVLEELSKTNAQIIVTTHSPYFVSGRGFEAIRLVRKDRSTQQSAFKAATYAEVAHRLALALGKTPAPIATHLAAFEQILQPSQSELFFCSCPILVEGGEDIAYLATYLKMAGKWDELRRLGGHFVVAGGKTNMSRPLAAAQLLGIDAFAVFDADGNCKDEDRHTHERDNTCILRLAKSDADAFPTQPLFDFGVIAWPTNIGEAVREELGETWSSATESVRIANGWQGVSAKNTLFIAAAVAESYGKHSPIALLEKATDAIMRFASSGAKPTGSPLTAQ
jgi:energy-coupling factor transporter ATP-binding protein EcfA2